MSGYNDIAEREKEHAMSDDHRWNSQAETELNAKCWHQNDNIVKPWKKGHGHKMLLLCFESLLGKMGMPSKMIVGLTVIQKVVANVDRWRKPNACIAHVQQ